MYWRNDKVLHRLVRNAGILLTGNVAASALGLISLAVTARALGPENFGILVLISTYVLVVDRIINFQSWQALIRYGAEALQQGKLDDFKSLLKFGFLLDVCTAAAGTVVAATTAWLAGNWQGWSSDTTLMTTLYSITILFHVAGTPTAILRLFDNFKGFSVVSVTAAAVKLVGVLAAYALGGGLWAFAIVWMLTDIVGKLLLANSGVKELRRQKFRGLLSSNIEELNKRFPGIWGFVVTTNINASIRMTTKEVDTIVVGFILNPSGVGLYKIAKQIANVLAIAAEPLYQSIYPEFAKMQSQRDDKDIVRFAARASSFAGIVAVFAWSILALIADPMLLHLFGKEFIPAKPVMLWYMLAIVIAVFAFPLQPLMLSMGKPHRTLWIHVISAIVYFICLVPALEVWGLPGAGISYVLYYIIWTGLMCYSIQEEFKVRRPQ